MSYCDVLVVLEVFIGIIMSWLVRVRVKLSNVLCVNNEVLF